ncbi:MAG: hypothetical protein DRO67_01660 [Candidatus Asgardarchaeum californiense]|nr:MAG: hypothetical protein DRO67_01660 [Candidatus Asgardarchaeum californiense]
MMDMKYYCDRCGKVIQDTGTTALPMRTVTTYLPDGQKKQEYYHLYCTPKSQHNTPWVYDGEDIPAGYKLAAQENSELNSEVSCQKDWISVEDRLPEEHETVNVYAYQGVVSAGWYCGDNMWLVMREPIRVTHWQPLPTPPKEGE